jgi:hypothetical protein
MATNVKNAQERAVMAANKDVRARDAALALQEYEAEKLAVRANIARLRALRLAQEAANSPPTKEPARKKRSA